MRITKLAILVLIVLIAAGTVIFFSNTNTEQNTFEERREKLLSQLYLAIEDAEKMGKYKCCIEPLCTMCYLGNWVWEDGTCDCDGMIAMGDWDKVCPQCKRGIEEGRCKSEIGACSFQ